MAGQIEVGDVFTFEDGLTEYTCTHASKTLLAAGYSVFTPDRCKLVRKAAYAIPINPPQTTAPMSWQFRFEPWKAKEPVTLADCVEGVDVVCNNTLGIKSICRRIGKHAWNVTSGGVERNELFPAEGYEFIRYLDPQPATLDDVPDGRVIRANGHEYWKCGQTWWRLTSGGGVFPNVSPSLQFTVTDYIAEFK